MPIAIELLQFSWGERIALIQGGRWGVERSELWELTNNIMTELHSSFRPTPSVLSWYSCQLQRNLKTIFPRRLISAIRDLTRRVNEFLIKENCYLISRGPSGQTLGRLPLIIYFPVLWPLDVVMMWESILLINIPISVTKRNLKCRNKFYIFTAAAPGDDVTC